MSEQTEKLDRNLKKHNRVILDVFIQGLWITAMIMIVIMVLGVFKIGLGIFLEFDLFRPCVYNETNGLIKILKGLELIFLSPLFYLLVLSLTKYISATKPEINPDSLEIKKAYMNHAIMEIMNVKSLSVSLFISVLILHSLGLILEDKMNTPLIIYIISLMTVLIIYYFILDRLVEKLRKI